MKYQKYIERGKNPIFIRWGIPHSTNHYSWYDYTSSKEEVCHWTSPNSSDRSLIKPTHEIFDVRYFWKKDGTS